MQNPLSQNEINTLHQDSIIRWKNADLKLQEQGFLRLVEENHAFNFQLWHAEDRARREDLGFEYVYHAKRDIDGFNQQRNNRVEAIDAWLFQALNPAPIAPNCPLHSETPGMMIDRLSILALKTYHMALQTTREDVEPGHRQTCQEKLQTLQDQQQHLSACLADLIGEILAKTRTFKIYHQFKMYNDPTLNPELYGVTTK